MAVLRGLFGHHRGEEAEEAAEMGAETGLRFRYLTLSEHDADVS
jgi:hypothetical protein